MDSLTFTEPARTVWKFPLGVNLAGAGAAWKGLEEIEMPLGARLLSVGYQQGAVCLWALVDPAAPRVKRLVAIVGTGHPAPSSGVFIGTVMLLEGGIVLHVFVQD